MSIHQYSRITLLVNPKAGSGTGARVALLVETAVRETLTHATIEVVQSQSSAHVKELAEHSDADLILCVSGDGTLHDLAQALMCRPAAERPAIATVPAGSGNDYARTLGVSLDPRKALASLDDWQEIRADVGRVDNGQESTYFLETLSFGVDAAVALNTETRRQASQSQGFRLYAGAAVDAILHELVAHKARYRIDDKCFEHDLVILAIQNGPTYGSGFLVAPRARITDGVLDVYTARDIGRLKGLYYLSRMKGGKHERLKGFANYRARHIEVAFDEPVPIQCDGEKLEGRSFTIDVIPSALEVLTVPDHKNAK
ncbi:MAG: diacylglycerol kinase family lipid kinase [Coriobacteriales bacterium]|jgi:YegS/Rv2252/BmrU family lipid kinase|nr:diacylglycerol kinase family lipid kinase [Coriobacteriales bacterium]